MIDINLIRSNLDAVKASLKKKENLWFQDRLMDTSIYTQPAY